MQLTRGCVAKSLAGHDAERFYAVLSVEGSAAKIADGKVRRLERPKRKSTKHLAPTGVILSDECMATNNQLKRALRELNAPKASASIKGR